MEYSISCIPLRSGSPEIEACFRLFFVLGLFYCWVMPMKFCSPWLALDVVKFSMLLRMLSSFFTSY